MLIIVIRIWKMEMKITNKELCAAQDQLDRAAKRGWSRGRNVALHFEPRRIIAYLLFMEFYKYMYHPVHVFFRHRKTLSLFNNRLMLQQTKLFFWFFLQNMIELVRNPQRGKISKRTEYFHKQ